METSNIKQSALTDASASAVVFTDTIPSDVSGDFTLPDYLPAIRKIVTTTARVMPGSRFISGTDSGESGYIVNFGGDVAYTVLYISEDGELCGCNLRDAYDGSTSIGRQNGAVTADTNVLTSNCRVTAPRKLTLKSKLKTRVTVCSDKDISVKLPDMLPEQRDSLQYLTTQTPALKLLHTESTNHHFSGEMNTADTKRLIKSDVKAAVKSVEHKQSDGYVTVSGEFYVKCIYADNNGIVTSETDTLAFSEEVDISGANEIPTNNPAQFTAHATVSNFDISESDGLCNYTFSCIIDVTAVVPKTAAICTDVYSTLCPCDIKTREIETLSPLSCSYGTVTIAETVPKNPTEDEIIDTDATVNVERAEIQDGKLELSGTVLFSLLCGQSDNAAVTEHTLPFKYAVMYNSSAPKPEGDIFYRCTIVCPDVKCTVSGDKLTMKTEAHVSVNAMVRSKHGCVDTVNLDMSTPFKREDSVIYLYYPESEETLWSAAKKYHIPIADMARKNKLTDASPTVMIGDKPLLV